MIYALSTDQGIRLAGFLYTPSLVIATIRKADGETVLATVTDAQGPFSHETGVTGTVVNLVDISLKGRVNWEALDEDQAKKLAAEPDKRSPGDKPRYRNT